MIGVAMRRSGLAAMTAAPLLLSAALPVAAQTVTMTPALKAVAEAADKEGQVAVLGTAESWNGPKGAKVIEDRLNKTFGTHIKVRWSPTTSFPETGNQIALSYRNNMSSPTDVYISVGRNLAQLEKFDLFRLAPWNDYLPGRASGDVVEDGKYVKLYTGTLGFGYNTAQSPSKPETLLDFLKPEWKGKIATTAFGSGFEQLASKDAWGPEKTLDYAKKLVAQVGGLMLCTEPERIASGEFLALVTDCSGGITIRSAAAGAPLARVIAPDNPIVTYGYGSVPKNAAHPNAAMLYILYLLSEDGQQLTWSMNYLDLDLLPGSHTSGQLQEVEKKYGFTYIKGDVAWQKTNDAGNATQAEVAKIVQSVGK
jgi:ABC-type Fe3+ transport system substrate-binding protein